VYCFLTTIAKEAKVKITGRQYWDITKAGLITWIICFAIFHAIIAIVYSNYKARISSFNNIKIERASKQNAKIVSENKKVKQENDFYSCILNLDQAEYDESCVQFEGVLSLFVKAMSKFEDKTADFGEIVALIKSIESQSPGNLDIMVKVYSTKKYEEKELKATVEPVLLEKLEYWEYMYLAEWLPESFGVFGMLLIFYASFLCIVILFNLSWANLYEKIYAGLGYSKYFLFWYVPADLTAVAFSVFFLPVIIITGIIRFIMAVFSFNFLHSFEKKSKMKKAELARLKKHEQYLSQFDPDLRMIAERLTEFEERIKERNPKNKIDLLNKLDGLSEKLKQSQAGRGERKDSPLEDEMQEILRLYDSVIELDKDVYERSSLGGV